MTFPPNSTALYKEQPVTVSCYTPDGVQIEKGDDLLTVAESELMPLAMPTPLPELAVSKRQRETVTLLLANNAGGVGKTSITVALAHQLSLWSLRVAVLDFDPQANATTFSGVLRQIEPDETFDRVIRTPDAAFPDFIPVHGYDLLPASAVLRQTSRDLARLDDYTLLSRHMEALRDRYDLILIDCGPSLDPLAMTGAMVADYVVTPSSTSVKGVDGFGGVAEFVAEIQALGNPGLEICLYIPTLHTKRTKAEAEAYAAMVENLPADLLATPILRNQKWVDATRQGQPVTVHAPRSAAAQQVERLARELITAIGWDSGHDG